ncbi:MAG TPA: hypothetical protein VH253_01275 [Phycisphaerae bacterium]|nr:hypothetical protein [Phycisphaerae bacterium]
MQMQAKGGGRICEFSAEGAQGFGGNVGFLREGAHEGPKVRIVLRGAGMDGGKIRNYEFMLVCGHGGLLLTFGWGSDSS